MAFNIIPVESILAFFSRSFKDLPQEERKKLVGDARKNCAEKYNQYMVLSLIFSMLISFLLFVFLPIYVLFLFESNKFVVFLLNPLFVIVSLVSASILYSLFMAISLGPIIRLLLSKS